VATLIASTAVLAMCALWQSLRATRLQAAAIASQQRAETAEDQARSELWRALTTEARATRRGPSMTRRTESLETIRRAAAISPSLELRNEAIAALALPEDRIQATVPLDANVRAYDFDPLLRQAAVGMENGDTVVYQLPEATVTHRFRLADGSIPEGQGAVAALAFSQAGDVLAVRHSRGALAVWDLSSGRIRFLRDADQLRRPASRGVFSTDGKVLVAPVLSPDGFAAIDARTGETIRHFGAFSSYHHCAVRPGRTQFAVYMDEVVSVMDWQTGEKIAEYAFPDGARTEEWSPDGRLLAIAGSSLQVHVWDVAAGIRTVLSGPKDSVLSLHFDPAGQQLAAVTADRLSLLWKLPEKQPFSVFEGRRFVRWGPSGATGWAVSRQQMELRRPATNPAYARLAGRPEHADEYALDVSADGRWAVSKASNQGLLVWDLEEPGPPEFIALQGIHSLCFDPVHPKLILLRNDRVESCDVSVSSGGGRTSLPLSDPLSESHVGSRRPDLVTASADGQTRAYVWLKAGKVWVVHLGKEPGLVEMEGALHSSVDQRSGSAFGTGTISLSTNGQWLALGVDGGTGTSIFDTLTGQRVRTLDHEFGGVQFSPDGRWLVLATRREIKLFRAGDWTQVWSKTPDPQSANSSGAAAFSPDGALLAFVTGSSRVMLLASGDGRELGVLESPEGVPIRTARWTRNGQRLVLSTRDNTLQVWNPGALRTELAALNLDWSTSVEIAAAAPRMASTVPLERSSKWIALLLLAATGAAAFVALGFLRHHRLLLGQYSRAEMHALERDKELQVERELHELKSQFVSTVSHEFRTPLGVIMASAENLRDYHDRFSPEQRAQHLRDIFDASKTMSGLMEEVLLLGRVDSGKVTYRPADVDIPALCERLVEEVKSATGERGRVQIRDTTNVRCGRGDEGLLRHILVNLLTNAVKYSPHDKPVELAISADEPYAVFTIRDQGIGIPAEDLPNLFAPFHRGANVGEVPGSGLGLVIVKRCVELHGGTIECESTLGVGTTVTVRLPLFTKLS